MARKKSSSGGFGWGFVVGLVVAAVCAFAYFKFGPRPVPVANKPVPFEKSSALPPPPATNPRTNPRTNPATSEPGRETHLLRTAPFGISEDVFEAGAHVYVKQCASCHGTPRHDGASAKHTNPAAKQLWKRYGSAVGVSDEAVGETYWKVANGIHQSGMPAYQHVLSETQMWQVSLLLKNADQQLPDPVMGILGGK